MSWLIIREMYPPLVGPVLKKMAGGVSLAGGRRLIVALVNVVVGVVVRGGQLRQHLLHRPLLHVLHVAAGEVVPGHMR